MTGGRASQRKREEHENSSINNTNLICSIIFCYHETIYFKNKYLTRMTETIFQVARNILL